MAAKTTGEPPIELKRSRSLFVHQREAARRNALRPEVRITDVCRPDSHAMNTGVERKTTRPERRNESRTRWSDRGHGEASRDDSHCGTDGVR